MIKKSHLLYRHLHPAPFKTTIVIDINVPEWESDLCVMVCPSCNGLFAIDFTFLDQVSDDCVCPMCQSRITVEETT
jgi:hypothetical protein